MLSSSVLQKLRVSTAIGIVLAVCPTIATAQEAYLNRDVPAFVDTGATNQRGDARYATEETNAAVRLLSGFLDIWQPRTPFVDAGTSAPAGNGFPAVNPTDWDGIPGSATDGTILNRTAHDYNIQYVIDATRHLTAQQATDAYLDDRRGKGFSMITGLGPLQDPWVAGTGQFTTITGVPVDAATVKYEDGGNNTGITQANGNDDLGLAVELTNRIGADASTEPSKRFFKYARPWRWSNDVTFLPTLESAKSGSPVTDGGFPSGHTAEAWRDGLAMAYLVPQRFQEIITRAVLLGDNRILAGMHSPFDVIGGRMLGTASVVYNLNRPNDVDFAWQDLKRDAYSQTQAWLMKETDSATAVDLYVAAHSADLSVDRFASREANAAYVADRMTYGFAPIGAIDQPVAVPKGAEVLLETRMPYLTADQRRTVLVTTALPSGMPIMDDAEGYGRLDLFTAADGYGAFPGDVVVDMDKSLDGFNAFDAWNNDIGGVGKLTKEGTGTLMLTGLNTYSGGSRVGGGMLVGTHGGAFGTGGIEIDQSGQLVVNTLIDGTLANDISGTGIFDKRGTGNLVYTGNGSQFTGTTLVGGGRFAVNGSWGGALEIQEGAVLGGSGTVGSVTLTKGSRLSPGNSIGTINVKGDLKLPAGSIYELDVGGDGQSDRTIVSGEAVIDGAGVNVITLDPAISYAAGQSYSFLTAGKVTGQFASLSIDSAFIGSQLFYTPTDVTLRLATWGGRAFATAAQTSNQAATASALDKLSQTEGSSSLPLYNSILFMNAESARAAFDQLSGEEHASVQSALLNQAGVAGDTVLDRLSTGRTGIWTSGYARSNRFGTDGNAASYDLSGGDVFFGGDGLVGDDIRLGIMTGWGQSTLESDRTTGSADIETYHVGLYGGTEIGPWQLKTGATYSFSQIDAERSPTIPGRSDRLEADYDAGLAQVFGEVSYGLALGDMVHLSPFANLSHAVLSTDGFAESGGATALSATDARADASFTTIGLRGSGDFDGGASAFGWNAMAGWRHAFGDSTPETQLSFADGGSFSVSGVPIGRDTAQLSVGLDATISPAAKIGISYRGEFSEDHSENGVRADFALRF